MRIDVTTDSSQRKNQRRSLTGNWDASKCQSTSRWRFVLSLWFLSTVHLHKGQKISEGHWRSECQWSSDQWRSMKVNEDQWRSMKVSEGQNAAFRLVHPKYDVWKSRFHSILMNSKINGIDEIHCFETRSNPEIKLHKMWNMWRTIQ